MLTQQYCCACIAQKRKHMPLRYNSLLKTHVRQVPTRQHPAHQAFGSNTKCYHTAHADRHNAELTCPTATAPIVQSPDTHVLPNAAAFKQVSDDETAPTIAKQLFQADCSNSPSCSCKNSTNVLGQTSWKHRTNSVSRLQPLLSAIRQFDARPQVNSSRSDLHSQSCVSSPTGTASCRPWTTKSYCGTLYALSDCGALHNSGSCTTLWPVPRTKHPRDTYVHELSNDMMCHITGKSLHKAKLCHMPR